MPTAEELEYRQYLQETGQIDPEKAEYEQYLAETGQTSTNLPPPRTIEEQRGRVEEMDQPFTGDINPLSTLEMSPNVKAEYISAADRARDVYQQSKPGMYGPPMPDMLPQELMLAQRSLSTATGQMPAGAAATTASAPVRAAGRGISKLSDYLLGKVAGLSAKEARAYKQSPEIVQGFAKELKQGSKSNISAQMQEEMGAANEALQSIGHDLDSQVRTLLQGKSVPPKDYLKGISREADQALSQQDLMTGAHPAEAIHAAKKALQQEAKFKPSTLVTEGSEAKQKAAGKAAGELKRELEALAPETKSLNKANSDLIKLQEKLVKGSRKPRSFVKSDANTEVLEQVDKAVGTRLSDMSNAYKAAGKLVNPRGLKEDIGGKALSASQALQRGSSKATKAGTKLTLEALLGASAAQNSKRKR